jgi:hypothetical protein
MAFRMTTRPRVAVLAAALACAACGGAGDDVTGTYMLDQTAGAGCVLGARAERKVVDLVLQCTAAGAWGSQGTVTGTAGLNDGAAVYSTAAFGHACEIRIRFRGSRAVVSQAGSAQDCGMPAGVVAAGTYRRTSRDAWRGPLR